MEWQAAIRERMDARSMTQAGLAKALNVSRTTVTNLLTKPPDTKGSIYVEPASELLGLTLLPLYVDESHAQLLTMLMELDESWSSEYRRITQQTRAAHRQMRKRRT